MKALSRMMSFTVDKRLLSGFLVGSRNNEEIIMSHLLFVDDTLIFCEADCEKLRHLWCLLCFEVVLGLKINLSKSEIVPLGDVGDLEGLASILGCRVASLPIKNLGLTYQKKKKRIWVLLWELFTRLLLFRMASLRKWNLVWQDGRGFIYLRDVG